MKDERLYLIHIKESLERIHEYTRCGQDAFLKDTLVQDAVVRNFEIVGEAAKRISEPIRQLAPNIPWRTMAGFRDILIHQYERVDVRQIWNAVVQVNEIYNDLCSLLARLDANFSGN